VTEIQRHPVKDILDIDPKVAAKVVGRVIKNVTFYRGKDPDCTALKFDFTDNGQFVVFEMELEDQEGNINIFTGGEDK
jgi:hypothetical protein